jgi:hypothetical protein
MGLDVNGPCRASPPCLVSCPSPARLFVLGRPGPHRTGPCRARTGPKQRASCWAQGPRAYWTSILSSLRREEIGPPLHVNPWGAQWTARSPVGRLVSRITGIVQVLATSASLPPAYRYRGHLSFSCRDYTPCSHRWRREEIEPPLPHLTLTVIWTRGWSHGELPDNAGSRARESLVGGTSRT